MRALGRASLFELNRHLRHAARGDAADAALLVPDTLRRHYFQSHGSRALMSYPQKHWMWRLMPRGGILTRDITPYT
jgi:hypothetical protein